MLAATLCIAGAARVLHERPTFPPAARAPDEAPAFAPPEPVPVGCPNLTPPLSRLCVGPQYGG